MPIPLKLLLVEDDPLDAELNILNLESEGFQCDWQRVQIEKALTAALQKERYDLLLIDYNLPGFDGLKALHIVEQQHLNIPVIFVTGNLQTELAIKSIKAGAFDFVHKDRLARLGSSVRRALREFALRRANDEKKAELDMFRKLNEAANAGASLFVLSNILVNALQSALGCAEVAVYLRSREENSLTVYNPLHDVERLQKIEKIIGVSIPEVNVSLAEENIFSGTIRQKTVSILDSRKDIAALYQLYLEAANFPEKTKQQIRESLPRLMDFLKIEKILLFPLITGEQAIGLLELSYKSSETGEDLERVNDMLGQITAIFARRRTEEELGKLHEQQKMILDSAAEGIMGMDMEGNHIFVNPAAAQMLGYEVSELLSEKNHIAYHLDSVGDGKIHIDQCHIYSHDEGKVRGAREYETDFVRKDGTVFPISYTSSKIIKNGEAVGMVLAFRDISEQVENTRERARLAQVVDQVQVSVGITDLTGNLVYVNPFFEEVSGYSKTELLGKNPRILKSGYQSDAFYQELWETLVAGKSWKGKLVNKNKQGDLYHEDAIIFSVKTEAGETINYVTVKREVSVEVEAQKRIERQLSRFEALHLIDTTILASTDLPQTLDVVLGEAMKELQLDAVDFLVFNPALQSFSCVSRSGFYTDALEFTDLHLGEGLAGRAGLTRELVHVDELSGFQQGAPHLSEEKFVSYYGVPLIAKGELKGVMEVFLRRAFEPDDEWLNYLDVIAGQAAIAIENKQLFNDLYQKNAELSFAYEATLEGWVHGLELHDRETEGHSRRVVDMTLRVARRMGVDEEQLVHIRRGSLLHDIGKLAIPEHILNKKGPFNAEEKALMQKHTIYAYEMLADIPFLKAALDIPSSHHEKWDGSGYPLGLRGTSIPFPARIFAIIDVYDALITDRPYRKAWDRETVLDYLQNESGKHFDPEVVEAFFDEFVFQQETD